MFNIALLHEFCVMALLIKIALESFHQPPTDLSVPWGGGHNTPWEQASTQRSVFWNIIFKFPRAYYPNIQVSCSLGGSAVSTLVNRHQHKNLQENIFINGKMCLLSENVASALHDKP